MHAVRHPGEPEWPPMKAVMNRHTYRERPPEELEECTWPQEDDPTKLADPAWVRLASTASVAPATIIFVNATPYDVRPLWMDFDGSEVAYSVIEPGTTKRYRTYITHPWICREVESGVRMMLSARMAVVGLSEEQTVYIRQAPLLEWNTERHRLFPEECRQRTLALLLSHKHLEKVAAAHAIALAAVPRARVAAPDASAGVDSAPGAAAASAPRPPRRFQSDDARCTSAVSQPPCPGSPMSPTRPNPSEHVSAGTTPAGAAARGPSAPLSPGRSPTSSCEPAGSMTSQHGDAIGDMVSAHPLERTPSPGQAQSSASPPDVNSPSSAPFSKRGVLSSVLCAVKSGLFGIGCSSSSQADVWSTLTTRAAASCRLGPARPAADDPAWPPSDAHLGHVPSFLVRHIVEPANKTQYTVYQTMYQPPLGRPDITPVLLPGPPPAAAPAPEGPADADPPPPVMHAPPNEA